MADVIAALPGDGIGPEVLEQAVRVLERLPLEVEVVRLPFGGAAIDATGEPLPAATLEACRASRAVLLGAVGGPRWDGGSVRPEQGLLGLRKALDVYANLRPATQGEVDLLIVRELVGGLYFGARGVRADGTVFDTCEYHPDHVARIVRRGFELARSRRRSLVSVDKANVLDTSRMWRRVVDEIAPDYPDVAVRHALVDSFAMELVNAPGDDRRRGDGEHVRRHPLGHRRRGHRRARAGRVGEPRRRRPRDLRAGARLGSRSRRDRNRESRCDAQVARAAARARAASGAISPPRSSRPSTQRSSRRPPPTSAATPRPTAFGDAVLASLLELAPR